MSFVLARKNDNYLDTPVFHAGPQGDEEAVAVFTNRSLAEQYLVNANWTPEYEVGKLEPIQLARWLVMAREHGIDMLVVDPELDDQLEGEQQRVIFLGDPLEAFAETLRTEIEKLERSDHRQLH